MSTDRQDTPQQDFDLDRLAAEVEQTPLPARKSGRTGLIVGGIVGLVVLLGAAAFMAFRLVGNGEPEGQAMGGGPRLMIQGPSGGESRSYSVEMTPAPELPTTPPDLIGTYSRQDGNSLFVHQVAEGAFDPSSQNTGPEVEIVITADTKIYRDTTGLPEPDSIEEGVVMQQTVELVESLDNLSEQTFFRVWGERRGDRVVAQVIFYAQPVIIERSGP